MNKCQADSSNTTLKWIAIFVLGFALVQPITVSPVLAGTITCSDGRQFDENDAVNGNPCAGEPNTPPNTNPGASTCGDAGVAVGTPGIKCSGKGNPIYDFLGFIINWAIGLIGALAVLAIVISGVQYISSQGNPDGVKKAKGRLVNAVIGLIMLSLTRVILGFLKVI